VPAEHVEGGQFVGGRDFEAVSCVPCWKDLSPRVGAAYDLFGNGRTALKASVGRYVGKESVSVAQFNNPILTSVNSANRTWNDSNRNLVPDCVLTNFAGNGECGPISNTNFGKVDPRAVKYSDDMINGLGVRDYLWDLTAEVQQELRTGTSLTVGYYRNWSNQFRTLPRGDFSTVGVTDNLAQTPADFSQFCITAPTDSRLPGGGGYPVCGLYDVSPQLFGVGSLLVTRASNYGNGARRTSDFLTASINSRLGRALIFSGSLDTGRTVEDHCFVVDSPQSLLFCNVVTPFAAQTRVKMNASYTLPRGFIVSGVYQNLPGSSFEANYSATNAEIAPSLGRNLAACGASVVCSASVSVPLFSPQTQFLDRQNRLDLRLSKMFSRGARAMRVRLNLDVYNAFNDGAILTPNNSYGSNWLLPAGPVLAARTIQMGAQVTF